jgi:tape measure domain-containing protein
VSAVANVAIEIDARSAIGQLRQLQGQAGQTERAFSGLTAAAGKLAVAAAAIQAARFVFAKTAELETQTRSLQVLTGSAEKAKAIIQELQQLGAVTPFTSTELIDSAKRLQAFGVEANKVVETTKRLADVSGATGAELQGLVTAYGQVQAKGRLQGEELLQFQERGVALQEELRKMYGLSGEEFQKAMSKGQVSAEAVEVAVKRLTDAGGKYANGAISQSDSLNGKLSTLQDSVDELARKVGGVLSPAVKGVIDYLIGNVGMANKLITDMGLAWQYVTSQLQPFIDSIQLVQGALSSLQPPDWLRAGLTGMTAPGQIFSWLGRGQQAISGLAAQQRGRADLYGRYIPGSQQIRPGAAPGATVIPALLNGNGGGGRGGGGGRTRAGKSDAEREAERRAKAAKEEEARVQGILRNRAAEVEIFDLRFQIDSKINKAEKDGDQMLAARLRGAQKELDLQYQYAQLLADPQNKDARIQEQITYQGTMEILSNQILVERELEEIQKQRNQNQMNGLQAVIEKQYQLNTAVQQQLQLADSIANTIGQGIASAFDGLITGSENWGQSLQKIASGVLTDIANQLIRIFIIEQAVNAIKSFLTPFSPATPFGAGGGMVGKFGTLGPNYGIPQRAMGGPVTAGQSYIVGERGPELFTPGIGGRISPNGGSSGNSVKVDSINITVENTGDQLSPAAQKQIAGQIRGIVLATLVDQRRGGGVLR